MLVWPVEAIYAFYCDQIARKHHNTTTVAGSDPSERYVVANWIGPAVEGSPGFVKDGKIIRPEAWKLYKMLGDVRDGQFAFPFPDRLRALPDSVFEADEMYREHAFFSPKEHKRDRGRFTLQGLDEKGKPVCANWIGSKMRGLPDDGFPGYKIAGHFQRPENFETFKYVGRVGPDNLSFEVGTNYTFLELGEDNAPFGMPNPASNARRPPWKVKRRHVFPEGSQPP